MSDDLENAKALLLQDSDTCVLCRGTLTLRSRERGIAPLLTFLDSGEDTCGFSAADRVVGKAAAMLYCLLGVRRVYGRVMSVGAVKLLRKNGVEAYWDTLTEAIRNRAGTGLCPMEAATQTIDEPEDALPILRATLAAMRTS